MTHLRWLLVLMVFSLPSLIRADIFGDYAGMEKMLGQSDAVAIVKIVARVAIIDGREMTMAEFEESRRGKRWEYNPAFTINGVVSSWRVQLVRPIKGDAFERLTTDTLSMGLGPYPIIRYSKKSDPELDAVERLQTVAMSEPMQPIKPGQCYLVFLRQSSYDLSFTVLNLSGSMIPVSPDFAKDLNHAELHDAKLLRELLIRESEEDPATITAGAAQPQER
ncbi:hypothetical protein GC173_14025 [bacterium]|nr:hypothetical protein [bacterium]